MFQRRFLFHVKTASNVSWKYPPTSLTNGEKNSLSEAMKKIITNFFWGTLQLVSSEIFALISAETSDFDVNKSTFSKKSYSFSFEFRKNFIIICVMTLTVDWVNTEHLQLTLSHQESRFSLHFVYAASMRDVRMVSKNYCIKAEPLAFCLRRINCGSAFVASTPSFRFIHQMSSLNCFMNRSEWPPTPNISIASLWRTKLRNSSELFPKSRKLRGNSKSNSNIGRLS